MGRYVSKLTGPAYSAAKHGLVALSESLNQEECGHGIRSCCICPGEVATPIIDKRPVPVTEGDEQRMLQSDDLAEMILFVALPAPRFLLRGPPLAERLDIALQDR